MKSHVLPSGVTLNVGLLAFQDAWPVAQRFSALISRIPDIRVSPEALQAIMAEAKAGDDADQDELVAKMLPQILALKGPIASLLSSPEMPELAKACFVKCNIDGVRISDETFSDSSRWGDYVPAMFWALKENVSPFFASLGSLLSAN